MTKKIKSFFSRERNRLILLWLFLITIMGVAFASSVAQAYFMRMAGNDVGYGYELDGSWEGYAGYGGWGYGAGVGYGENYGPNRNKEPHNYRVTGGDLSSNAEGSGYGYMLYNSFTGNIFSINTGMLPLLYYADVMSVPDNHDIYSTPSVTFGWDTKLTSGAAYAVISKDTTISCGNLDDYNFYHPLASFHAVPDLMNYSYNNTAAFGLFLNGCTNEGASLSSSKGINVVLSTDPSLDGTELIIYARQGVGYDWLPYDACDVGGGGYCHFSSSIFFEYAVGWNTDAFSLEQCSTLNPSGTMDIYLYYNNQYRKFASETLFLQHGFSYNDIYTTANGYDYTPLGNAINGIESNIVTECGSNSSVNICFDDDSDDIYVKSKNSGLENGDSYENYDVCVNSSTVREYLCSSNMSFSADYNCPGGCVDGACVFLKEDCAVLNPSGTMDIYLYYNNQYRKFASENVFLQNGFDFGDILTLSGINYIPLGNPITGAEQDIIMACASNNTCSDSDDMNKYNKGRNWGVVNGDSYENYDVCLDNNNVKEYWCGTDGNGSDMVSSFTYYGCTKGCFDGACADEALSGSEECSIWNPTGSMDIYIYHDGEYRQFASEVVYLDHGFDFGAIETVQVASFSPLGSKIYNVEQDIVNDCVNDGIDPTSYCTDSDNGKDYFVKGEGESVYNNAKKVHTDKCLKLVSGSWTDVSSCTGDYCSVQEGYCTGDSLSVENYTCPNGCSDGACTENAEIKPDLVPVSFDIVNLSNDNQTELFGHYDVIRATFSYKNDSAVDINQAVDYEVDHLINGTIDGDGRYRDHGLGIAANEVYDTNTSINMAWNSTISHRHTVKYIDFILTIDPDNLIDEANENNNTMTKRITFGTTVVSDDPIACEKYLVDYVYLSGFSSFDTLNSITNDTTKLSNLVDQVMNEFDDEFSTPNTYTPLIGQCTWMEHWSTGNCYIYSYKENKKVSVYTDQSCNDRASSKAKMIKAIKDGYCCEVTATTEYQCTDSDDGRNPYVAGSISGTDSQGGVYTQYDTCINNNTKVKEHWCHGTTSSDTMHGTTAGSTEYACPGGCLKGACLVGDGEEAPAPTAYEPALANTPDPEFSPTPVNTNNDRKIEKIVDSKDTLILKLQRTITAIEQKVVDLEKRLVAKIDKALTQRLGGRVLLQAENNGEAWFVDAESGNKFYMKDGQSAYEILKAFGGGITSEDVAKLPLGFDSRLTEGLLDSDNDGLSDTLEDAIGTDKNNFDSDGDGYEDGHEVENGYSPTGVGAYQYDQALINRLGDGILLQVAGENARGQAWLVKEGKRYYIDPRTAYNAMRYLSLGISNDDIRKIQVGEFVE